MKRRSFLKALLTFLGATSAVSILYPLSRYLAPPAGTEQSKTLVIAKREVPWVKPRKSCSTVSLRSS